MRPMVALAFAVALAGCTVGAAPVSRGDDAPVRFFAGADAREPVVASLSFGAQHTSFDVSLRGATEATTVADSIVRLQNVDDRSHVVLLRATSLADDRVSRLTFTFRDVHGEARGTLDLRAPAPAVELRLTRGETLDAQLVLGVEDGATGGATTLGVTVLD